MNNSKPLVSILIPCYNAERWVGAAIESALEQTWLHKEILVVDDGSTDQSLRIIESFGDRIRWETGPNRGGNAARNRLLELSRGDWLQYLDADDYLQRHKVEQQLRELPELGDVDAAYTPVVMEHWADNRVSRQETVPIPLPHDPWILLARWYLPQTGCVLWRKCALVDIGGWKSDQPCCQEHELYLRALMAGKKFHYCPTPGAVYRQWSEGTVCKKNVPEVHRRRLEIEQRMEIWLRDQGLLTAERLTAINQARFETARSVWQYDQELAAGIMQAVRRSQPKFLPQGAAAPKGYQRVYRLGGFQVAERLAAALRPRCMQRLA